ncbi:MAG: hypothetical protein BroJett022_15900 [Actinomycetes bacterium]|nr:MAG: hypothetical protein BroJett022_15900 [Actinomycetes bacterium]
MCYVRPVIRRGNRGWALVLAGLVAAAAPVAAPAAEPTDRCSGELLPGGTVNTPDPVRAGPASPLPASWDAGPRSLPRRVSLRGATATYNRLYEFALADGDLFARRRGSEERWRRAPLPDCLEGRLRGISADDDEMVGLDRDRNVYTMDNALKHPRLWNWSKRWGPPVWNGDGFALPANTKAWTWSVISPAEDGTWTDPAGNRYPVGEYKVSHIWGLRGGGRRLTFWDPWLPRDNSYEMCGPHDGRFRSVNLSASGSRVFVIGRRGDMFTRLYDFDISGHDPVFFTYSYEDQRGGGDGSPIQLPAEPWTRQPKIDGRITSAISVEKRGRDAVHATLRVEGRRRGRTGYWQRDVAAPRERGWSFHRTGGPLEGEPLRNPSGNTSRRGLGPSEDMRFVMRGGGTRAVIDDFNAYCSPARIEIREDGRVRRVTLHHVDGLRQVERARGLDDEPRQQYGALEWPSGRIEEGLQVLATRDEVEIPALGWSFERRR